MNNTSMVKKIGGAMAGTVLGAVLIAGGQLVVRRLHPLPKGTHFEDTETIAAYIDALPVTALAGILTSYFVACLLGSLTASKISRGASGPMYTTGALLLTTSLMNQLTIPHPTWFSAISPLMFISATALAIKLNNRVRISP